MLCAITCTLSSYSWRELDKEIRYCRLAGLDTGSSPRSLDAATRGQLKMLSRRDLQVEADLRGANGGFLEN